MLRCQEMLKNESRRCSFFPSPFLCPPLASPPPPPVELHHHTAIPFVSSDIRVFFLPRVPHADGGRRDGRRRNRALQGGEPGGPSSVLVRYSLDEDWEAAFGPVVPPF